MIECSIFASAMPSWIISRVWVVIGTLSSQSSQAAATTAVAFSASVRKESAKNSSAGRPQRALKSRRALSTTTGAPQA